MIATHSTQPLRLGGSLFRGGLGRGVLRGGGRVLLGRGRRRGPVRVHARVQGLVRVGLEPVLVHLGVEVLARLRLRPALAAAAAAAAAAPAALLLLLLLAFLLLLLLLALLLLAAALVHDDGDGLLAGALAALLLLGGALSLAAAATGTCSPTSHVSLGWWQCQKSCHAFPIDYYSL